MTFLSAFSGDLRDIWKGRALLALMTRREVMARVAGSALGGVWLYAQPLLTLAAYILVFDVVFEARVGSGSGHRAGTFLVVGMVPWMAFSDALSRGMSSLIEAAGLLQKNPLPPVLFPARAVASSAVTYLPLLLLVALAYPLVHGIGPAWLALPLLMCALYALAFVLAYLLGILSAAMRDVLQIAGFMLALGVFLSPVLYPPSMLPEGLRWLLWLNPMTPVVHGFQDILLERIWPGIETWLALAAWLGVSSLVLNHLIRRSRDHLVDWL